MDVMNKLRENVESQLEMLAKKSDLTPTEIENATKALCLLEKIDEYAGESDPSYSGMRYPSGMMMDDHSFRRGRSSVTGRYVSRGDSRMMDGSYGNYGPYGDRNGYSGHSVEDRAIAKLESMMDETNSEYERSALSKMITKLRHGE